MKSFIICVVSLMFSTLLVNGQTISGKVENLNGESIAGVNITLKKSSDSSIAKIGVTDAAGNYELQSIEAGSYFIEASFVGFQLQKTNVFEYDGANDKQIETIYMLAADKELQAVTIRATRPPIQAKADRLIMNVEGNLSTVGDDAIELLRKAPGVQVDKDDNISLAGKSGVQIYIDGKLSPLRGQDLANFLRSLPANAIDQIEIITNPSAKYDAAGAGGVINIKLKKNSAYGTNGSVNLGYGVGQLARYNGGASLNYKNRNISLFSNWNGWDNRNPQTQDIDRFIGDSSFIQRGRSKWAGSGQSFKLGADYSIGTRNTIGVMVDGNFYTGTWSNHSVTEIGNMINGKTRTVLDAYNSNRDNYDQMSYNLNYRYADTSGRTLNFDADYSTFKNAASQFQPNYYLNPETGQLESQNIYRFLSPSDIKMSSLKADYEQNLWSGKLGFGGKFTRVESDNIFQRYHELPSESKFDSLRSNDFIYKENISAVYVNYNRNIGKKLMAQAGLRMEHTSLEGRSMGFQDNGGGHMSVYDSSFTRSYTDLFPSVALSYSLNQANQFTVDYSRRIQRPNYQDLNPFETYLDEYTYNKGNTNLRPQYTNSFGITHIYKGRLVTKINYSQISDMFTNLLDTLGSRAYLTRKNLASQKVWSANVSYNYTKSFYTLITNVNGFHSTFKSNFGEGRVINNSVTGYTVWVQNSFRMGKGYTSELSGYYSSPSVWEGTFKQKSMGQINVGLSKNMLKDKATLKLTVNDIFKTMRFQGTSDFAGQTVNVLNTWQSRMFRVNFSYRFGNTKVKVRNRETGLTEEAGRVKTSG